MLMEYSHVAQVQICCSLHSHSHQMHLRKATWPSPCSGTWPVSVECMGKLIRCSDHSWCSKPFPPSQQVIISLIDVWGTLCFEAVPYLEVVVMCGPVVHGCKLVAGCVHITLLTEYSIIFDVVATGAPCCKVWVL